MTTPSRNTIMIDKAVQLRDLTSAAEVRCVLRSAASVEKLAEVTPEHYDRVIEALDAAISDELAARQPERKNGKQPALAAPYGASKARHHGPDMAPYNIGLPGDLHSDTTELVLDTANLMGQKLFNAQQKYGFKNGWKDTDWANPKEGAIVTGDRTCREHAFGHMLKGDPVDVANYMAFMMHHGWNSAPQDAAEAAEWVKRLQDKFDLHNENAMLRGVMDAMEERHGEQFNAFFEAIMLRVLVATGLPHITLDTSDLFQSLAGKDTTGQYVEIVEAPGQLTYVLKPAEVIDEPRDLGEFLIRENKDGADE